MGAASSRLEKALGEQFPEGERYFGLENFGTPATATASCSDAIFEGSWRAKCDLTIDASEVAAFCRICALYFCVPFREQLLEYYGNNKSTGDGEDNMLTCLADLFSQISNQKKKTGVIAPKRFIQRLKKQNEIFRSYMHQDAHEFLNFLLNELVDILDKESNNSSITSCLKNFSSTETLNADDKFFCDKCCRLNTSTWSIWDSKCSMTKYWQMNVNYHYPLSYCMSYSCSVCKKHRKE
ncbi:hypothetical protein GUJ93_ZPchr0013g34436 [Zizania palustris]|uniref:ubiquitinyl hydrolase 1 n=1 Tax=Zizania palustris TaxID=103762 RepID=A0A8J6BUX9_ZIZPA|nr:hypothetical protein GUJ93_ZPchr0013g34436 [Zizania palustris]